MPDKIGENQAFIVLASTRGNPGWIDIDLNQIRNDLSKEMPKADGIFYLLVKDGFGRITRIDVDYENWTRKMNPEMEGDQKTGRLITQMDLQTKYNWWDALDGGTKFTPDKAVNLNWRMTVIAPQATPQTSIDQFLSTNITKAAHYCEIKKGSQPICGTAISLSQ